jgi:hypothetical protein
MVASRKVILTDRFLKSLKPAPVGKRQMVWDAVQPHLGIRITDSGQCTFVIVKRRAGDLRPTRHILGRYPTLSIAEARLAAPKILNAFMNGDDPKKLEKDRLREAKLRQGETFELVAEEFLKRHVSKLKSSRSIELVIKRELLGLSLKRKIINGRWDDVWGRTSDPRWRDRPIGTIIRRDVVELLEKISDGGSRYQARKVFAILSMACTRF